MLGAAAAAPLALAHRPLPLPLPPAALSCPVVIARNQIDSIFWLNLLLTLLAWLPGVVHAYW